MEQPVILCVEDDERTRAQIKKQLSSKFKLLYFSSTSDEALSFITEIRPDIVYAGRASDVDDASSLIDRIKSLVPCYTKTIINSEYSESVGHISDANLCMAGGLDCDKLCYAIETLTDRLHSYSVNCWDYQKCGNGPLSSLPCSAAVDDGLNGGDAAGRFCWGIMSESCEKCSLASRYQDFECSICDFHQLVQYEEGYALVQ